MMKEESKTAARESSLLAVRSGKTRDLGSTGR